MPIVLFAGYGRHIDTRPWNATGTAARLEIHLRLLLWKGKDMGLQAVRSLRSRWLLAVALLIVMTLQVFPLAAPAAADMPPASECTYNGRLVSEEFADGTLVYWECVIEPPKHPRWTIWGIVPGPERARQTDFSDDSPPYKSYVNSGIGEGYTGGIGIVSYAIRNPNGTPLIRRIAVRLLIHNRTTGGLCSDTGWKEAPTQRANYTWEVIKDLPGKCGGKGNFETSAAGRFFSTSLNSWITTPWVQSGTLGLPSPTCCVAERSTRPSRTAVQAR